MDATVHKPGACSELALLRSRAYGPDADITGDANAMKRLAQLESAGKPPHPDAAVASVQAAPESVGAVPAGVGAAPASVAAAPASVQDAPARVEGPPDPAPTRSRRWLAGVVAAAAVVAALLGAGGLAVVQALIAPRPDAVLSSADVDPRTDATLDEQWLGAFSMNRDDLRGFDGYDGFRAWAGTSDDGLQCLFVLGRGGGLAAYSCTTSGLMPVADAQVADDSGVTAPPRRIIRFELHGDAVHVFDRPVPGAAKAS